MIVVFDDVERVDAETDGLWRSVCTHIGAVVVATIGLPAVDDAPSVLGWVAEHADQLNADPHRLVIAGTGRGAHHATVAALRARDDGWPPLIRQLLIQPELDTFASNMSFAGAAPVTLATLDGRPPTADARRCQLTQAGVAVETTTTERLIANLDRDLSWRTTPDD